MERKFTNSTLHTADEAIEVSTSNADYRRRVELISIAGAINGAANTGEFQCEISYLTQSARDKLVSLGYEIVEYFLRGVRGISRNYIIKWNKPKADENININTFANLSDRSSTDTQSQV